jgi:maltooligosyltrehalose trehalohydrolase
MKSVSIADRLPLFLTSTRWHVDEQLVRRLPIGAEAQPAGGTHFRIWAPRHQTVEVFVVAAGGPGSNHLTLPLTAEAGGYFSGSCALATVGARYGFRLNNEPRVLPDPASRFQPEGPLGLSQIVDPESFAWTDQEWRGVKLPGQVLYELHVGTFTQAGTWSAATAQLPRLKELGITLIEIMPVADFPGAFGWGYDGVNLFAPSRLYGKPDDMRSFVNTAHQLGMGVILDVVYNHFGPDGNFIQQFSSDYVTTKLRTDWGEAINFDGANSAPVREFFRANAAYWIAEYHLDGLRLDAVQAISDESAEHIIATIGIHARAAAGERGILIMVENELQDVELIRPQALGGAGLDAVWNDDFHHAARVALTGNTDYYYGDYQGTPQELISAVKWGYLYQGQWNSRQERNRGTPALDVRGAHFVTFLQNHDQVGNTPLGKRLPELCSPGNYRALTAFWLLSPGTPLFFQGQEYGSTTPFHYFADHRPEIGQLVRSGREQCQKQFRSLAGDDAVPCFLDPCEPLTFFSCKLEPFEPQRHAAIWTLHRDLLKLRREDPVFSRQDNENMHGVVLGERAFALRFFSPDFADRLLIVNLGRQLTWQPATEPLLAPPRNRRWRLLWSSEDPRYGGQGSGPEQHQCPIFAAQAAVVYQAVPLESLKKNPLLESSREPERA